MKKNNEDKMKEILEEFEEEMDVILEDEEDVTEEVDDTIDDDEQDLEESIDEEETKDKFEEETTIKIEEETNVLLEDKEKTEFEEDTDEEEKDFEIKLATTDSDIKKIGDYIIEKLLKYKYIIGLDFAIFLLLFFLIPQIIFEVKPYIWMTLFLIFTILPTMAFYVKNKFKDRQIMFGLIFFYLCILCILDRCTINDLYGITSHGTLDIVPAYMDAVLVTFIIVFFQYIGILVINIMRKLRKKKTR